jgi:tetratricopeptide (TPR) repeat protein
MNPRWTAVLGLLACAFLSEAQAPVLTPPGPNDHQDFSHEPFIIEQYSTQVRFESDGTSEDHLHVRVRIKNDAGVAAWSELVFGYDNKREDVEVRYVRIQKMDGSTSTLPTEAVQDTLAPAARDFPAYANCKEKHVSLASLVPGDTLEYEINKAITRPAAADQFWFEHKFIDSAIVLDERLEINLPATRTVIVKPSSWSYEIGELNGRKTYRWKHVHLKQRASSQQVAGAIERRSPDVELTSFGSWNELAGWYARVAQAVGQPTPEVRAKANALVQGLSNENEKAEAIYDYVSSRIRDVALPFGAAGYQPHTAAEVFSNQYGDVQDKQALLAAMLRSAHIAAEAVLISSARNLDRAIPSPEQFDRVLTVATVQNEIVWMDSTVDVAPYRMLAPGLRKKSALLISATGPAQIVETPADPPFLSTQLVDLQGQVNELGKLTARAHYVVRGDAELVLRSAFHRAPPAQWKEIGQTILASDGIHGLVTSLKASDPAETHDPFELEIDFAQSAFVDWSSKSTRTALPLLYISTPDPPADESKLTDLGSPLHVTVKLTLAFAQTFTLHPPVSLALTQDFAKFQSNYRFADHTLTAERTLDFKMRELPPERAAEYAAFRRAVITDANQLLIVENSAPGAISPRATLEELLETGRASFDSGNWPAAIPLLERVVQLDPQHKQAWNDLGLAYLRVGKLDEAIRAFQSQLEVNPSDEHAHQYLGLAFERRQNYSQAAAAFLRQTEINPLDPLAHGSLGDVLLEEHEYARAVSEFEKAIVLSPENARLQASLGRAYAETGKSTEAVAAFEKAAALSRSPETLNEVAFNLAEAKLALDKAQRYAEIAIREETEKLRSGDLAHVARENLAQIEEIAAFWDTLGWIYFQKNDLDHATRYIRAAWLLSGDGEAGDHLAQVYERLGQKDRAIHTCALALAAPHGTPDTRARLTLLLKGNAQIDDLVSKAKPELDVLRTIPAGKLLAEDARADFFVLLAPGDGKARVDAVRFISGNEDLRPFAERLRMLDYGVVFPDLSPTKLIRRGTLACSRAGSCTFTLLLPEDVRAGD